MGQKRVMNTILDLSQIQTLINTTITNPNVLVINPESKQYSVEYPCSFKYIIN